tara:strand:- start:94 stop:279 length:186 start_codon:yes stop_codon:yes gene_type:complete
MELKYRKMFFSQIYQHVYPMQKKSETKTHTNKQPGHRFMSRLIAYLKKKDNEDPKYLKGKK